MVLGQIPHNRRASQQAAQITGGQNQIEVVSAVALLDQLEIAVELRALTAHQLDLRLGQAAYRFALLFDQIFFGGGRNNRFGIAGRVLVLKDSSEEL